jgi:hypothetical protein
MNVKGKYGDNDDDDDDDDADANVDGEEKEGDFEEFKSEFEETADNDEDDKDITDGHKDEAKPLDASIESGDRKPSAGDGINGQSWCTKSSNPADLMLLGSRAAPASDADVDSEIAVTFR